MMELNDFIAVNGDELILRGPLARMVIYSALVTALVANEEELTMCVNMPERERLVLDWARAAQVLRETARRDGLITEQ
jgi:hypothetical protein